MLNQFASLSLADQKAMLATLRGAYATARADAKAFREQEKLTRAMTREMKAQAKVARQAAAIEKAQARLAKLLEKQAAPVGVKALKRSESTRLNSSHIPLSRMPSSA